MGSFAGVNINAQNLEQAVSLAEQKKILSEQSKLQSFSFNNYANDVFENSFPDGEYYVTSDFNSQLVRFQGDAYNPNQPFTGLPPVVKQFKKGELVKVGTFIKDMAMTKVKVIETSSGNFYADQKNLSKTKPMENIVPEVSLEAKEKNQNKLIIMVIGAFILGYLLSNE
jgi:hypothetical protein